MAFTPFAHLFPEIARHETKILTVPPGSDLPAGGYEFVEMYCDEECCECRRVMFSVLSPAGAHVEAVIAWGWESLDFYRRWLDLAAADWEMEKELQGPVLNLSSPQDKHAPSILRLTRDVLLKDPVYVDRLKTHYAMFREKIDHPDDSEKLRRQPAHHS